MQPDRCQPTETFLRAHAEHLPGVVGVIFGRLPRLQDQPFLPAGAAACGWSLLELLRGRTPGRHGESWVQCNTYSRLLKRLAPDVVLAQFGPTAVRLVPPCRRLNIPLVAHFHGFDASADDVLEKYRTGYRDLFSSAACLVVVSEAMRTRLIAEGAPPEKTVVNVYGVDCARFGGADPQKAPPVFLAAGRFVPKKSPHSTIRAFAKVYRQNDQARLRMIGDGPLLEECRRLAGLLDVEPAVTFLGAQPHEAVAREMRRARAFVQHSVRASNGDCEGTPVAILEAGASGLPVVATRHGGIPEVVVDGTTGLLVDEFDVPAMAEQMRLLAADPELAGRLGRAARQHICDHHSMSQSIERLVSILRQAGDADVALHRPQPQSA